MCWAWRIEIIHHTAVWPHLHTWDLKDALGAVVILDVQRICRVIDDEGARLLGSLHQVCQLLPGCCSPCGVVWGAEEDDV